MQTFFPLPDLRRGFQSLDTARLGKQVLEAKQILNVCEGLSTGYQNHPAVTQWRPYVAYLRYYLSVCVSVWEERQCKRHRYHIPLLRCPLMPWWASSVVYHASHAARLVEKDPSHYSFRSPLIGLGANLWPMEQGVFKVTFPGRKVTGIVTGELDSVVKQLEKFPRG